MKRLLLITMGTIALAGAGTALAAISSNTIDPTATIGKKGREVAATVLLGCHRSQPARLRVTVTQTGRAAVAQKRKKVSCTTAAGSFRLKAKARGRRRFSAGAATVCALAVTSDDARQWCKDVTLVGAAG